MVENSTNPSDTAENHDVTLYLEQMIAKDKTLSEKIASMIEQNTKYRNFWCK